MNNKLIISIIVAVVIVLGALWYFMTMQPAEEQKSATETPTELTVMLNEQNNSGVSGTAKLTQMGNGLNVVLNLSGAPENVTQPAHIHLNNCANIGGVKYPLSFPINGYSETTMKETLNSLPLSINVHKSTSEASVYVACGDIVKP